MAESKVTFFTTSYTHHDRHASSLSNYMLFRSLLNANMCVQKSKKAAAASEAAGSLPPPPVVVPAVMLSPDVVILPAASLQAAASSQADANGAAEGAVPGSASGRGSTGARAFKRVNDEEWLGKKGAWDNSYEAKFGNSGYGAKASQTLLQVTEQHAPCLLLWSAPILKPALWLLHSVVSWCDARMMCC